MSLVVINIDDIVVQMRPTIRQKLAFHLQAGGFLKRIDFEDYVNSEIRNNLELVQLMDDAEGWFEESDAYIVNIIRNELKIIDANSDVAKHLYESAVSGLWKNSMYSSNIECACINFLHVLSNDDRLTISRPGWGDSISGNVRSASSGVQRTALRSSKYPSEMIPAPAPSPEPTPTPKIKPAPSPVPRKPDADSGNSQISDFTAKSLERMYRRNGGK